MDITVGNLTFDLISLDPSYFFSDFTSISLFQFPFGLSLSSSPFCWICCKTIKKNSFSQFFFLLCTEGTLSVTETVACNSFEFLLVLKTLIFSPFITSTKHCLTLLFLHSLNFYDNVPNSIPIISLTILMDLEFHFKLLPFCCFSSCFITMRLNV